MTFINPPKVCDICHNEFGKVMYDAATRMGPWACMCEECFNEVGRNIGQKYELKDDKWEKVNVGSRL